MSKYATPESASVADHAMSIFSTACEEVETVISVEVGASLSRQTTVEVTVLVATVIFVELVAFGSLLVLCANTINIFSPFCKVVGALHVEVVSVTPIAL